MGVRLSPIGNDAPFVDANGNPLTGGKLHTYVAGSTTPQTTYTDSGGGTSNANPIELNSNGYPASGGSVVGVWLTEGQSYKFVLKTSGGTTVWTRDGIRGINDTNVTQDQWVASALTPTYVSGTSFTLAGDQTTAFHVGRRLKTTNSGGTVYSTITASVYGASTTVTVVNDSGSLDSGLSAVSYGLLTKTNPSIPLNVITNSLGAPVSLNNTGNFFDGPSIAQGTAGTWLVMGSVTVTDTAGAASVVAKLWDGTTLIASASARITGANVEETIALSGYMTSPAGNLRISVRDATSTSGTILDTTATLAKASTITAIRLA